MAFTSHAQMAAQSNQIQTSSKVLVAAGNAVQGAGHSLSSSALRVFRFRFLVALAIFASCDLCLLFQTQVVPFKSDHPGLCSQVAQPQARRQSVTRSCSDFMIR